MENCECLKNPEKESEIKKLLAELEIEIGDKCFYEEDMGSLTYSSIECRVLDKSWDGEILRFKLEVTKIIKENHCGLNFKIGQVFNVWKNFELALQPSIWRISKIDCI